MSEVQEMSLRFTKVKESFAALITLCRKLTGLTQLEVADALKIARSKISSIENGYDLPSKKRLDVLLDFYSSESTDVKYNLSKLTMSAWKREQLDQISKRIDEYTV